MEAWQKTWRIGIEPLLSDAALRALQYALANDDQRLLQGTTTLPPPLVRVLDFPVEGACPVGYCGWQGEGLTTVSEVEEYFGRICFETDEKIKERAGCRWFLNWVDETPREQMRRELLAEVELALSRRSAIQENAQ